MADREGAITTSEAVVSGEASGPKVEAESGAARKEIQRTFKHVSSMIGAYEAEEVGVEHLLRDVNDPTVSTLASQIKHKMAGLVALRSRLEMKAYLEALVNNKITNKRLEEEAENPKPKDDKKKGDPADGAKDGAKENEKPDAKADAKDAPTRRARRASH
ncbi:hypothetical protein JL722_8799 [Aureococcus anophagefferens]|nr:hypothetical protein JL722_8799 [Aureococcus anophagefferens]